MLRPLDCMKVILAVLATVVLLVSISIRPADAAEPKSGAEQSVFSLTSFSTFKVSVATKKLEVRGKRVEDSDSGKK